LDSDRGKRRRPDYAIYVTLYIFVIVVLFEASFKPWGFPMKVMAAALIGLFGFAGLAQAQAPVAVVEDVQGKVTGAEFMDYVAPGKVIKLGPGGLVVLGYMKSCRREIITGIGTVIVGPEESMVHLGDVKASQVKCDSSHSQLIDRDASESAATVVRSMDNVGSAAPRFTLYGLSPLVQSSSRGRLVIERLDKKGERYDVDLAATPVVRGKFYDLARTDTRLVPGGTYAATLGTRRVIFLVDARAEPGAGPVIGRLLRLE
jgi:hypothetical protein